MSQATTPNVQAIHRFAAHRRIKELTRSLILGTATAGDRQERDALQVATYWESFPHAYTDDQVAAAQALLYAYGEGQTYPPEYEVLVDAVNYHVLIAPEVK